MSRLAAAEYSAAFDGWWQREGVWVEPPNQRRGGESGVQFLPAADGTQAGLYSKRQLGHLYRSLTHPFGQPTILREAAVYRAFTALGVGVPRLLFAAARQRDSQWQALLVTEALEGFISLEQWYAQPRDAVATQGLLVELAATLARMHRGRWQHGCCYAKHIFVKVIGYGSSAPSAQVAVLDLEKSRRRWRMGDAARHDMRQLRRHCAQMPDADWALLERLHAGCLARPRQARPARSGEAGVALEPLQRSH